MSKVVHPDPRETELSADVAPARDGSCRRSGRPLGRVEKGDSGAPQQGVARTG